MGWEVKNDVRGVMKVKCGLKVSNMKMRKYLPGAAGVNLSEFSGNSMWDQEILASFAGNNVCD